MTNTRHRLFRSTAPVSVILPRPQPHLGPELRRRLIELPLLLRRGAEAIARELGAPLRVCADDPGHGPRWCIGPTAYNPSLHGWSEQAIGPWMHIDRAHQLLITSAPTMVGIYEAISTALTWDRRRRCVEGNGIVVDIRVVDTPTSPNASLHRALSLIGD